MVSQGWELDKSREGVEMGMDYRIACQIDSKHYSKRLIIYLTLVPSHLLFGHGTGEG